MSGLRNKTYSDGKRRASSLWALQKPVLTGDRSRYATSNGSIDFKRLVVDALSKTWISKSSNVCRFQTFQTCCNIARAVECHDIHGDFRLTIITLPLVLSALRSMS